MISDFNPDAPEFYPKMDVILKEGYLQATNAIRSANKFPIGGSYDLYETFPDFNNISCKIRENITKLSNRILRRERQIINMKWDGDDDSNTDILIEANDNILDRISINIDKVTGVYDRSEELSRMAAWNREPYLATRKINSETAKLVGAKNITRPQLKFKDPVDNTDSIFEPRIVDKPNSIRPLALTMQYDDEGEPVGYEHPYDLELTLYSPPIDLLLNTTPPEPPRDLASTPLTIVDTKDALDDLITHLDEVREIAVDLEHHSFRTYQGITCLIQISTDSGGDFIIDALVLREHLHLLNYSFTDPKKLKVFHGATNDILWLQRDFGVYVVGMFDTYFAAKRLELSGLSYLYLLQHYCRFTTDKTGQVADWRLRPLPDWLIRYARTDTHYLLYISRVMRVQLTRTQLALTFQDSAETCGQTYKKPRLDEESHMVLYRRYKKRMSVGQLAALRELYQWRERQARELDESTAYLLPNHMLLAVAEHLPREQAGLRALCHPLPPFVRQNIDMMQKIVTTCAAMVEVPAAMVQVHAAMVEEPAAMVEEPAAMVEEPAAMVEELAPPLWLEGGLVEHILPAPLDLRWDNNVLDLEHLEDNKVHLAPFDVPVLDHPEEESAVRADMPPFDPAAVYPPLLIPAPFVYLVPSQVIYVHYVPIYWQPYDRYRGFCDCVQPDHNL